MPYRMYNFTDARCVSLGLKTGIWYVFNVKIEEVPNPASVS